VQPEKTKLPIFVTPSGITKSFTSSPFKYR
jgi:hypothetical protein